MRIELDQNFAARKIKTFLKSFGKPAEVAVARSLNRAIQGVRTDSAVEVRKEYNVKATPVKKSFRMERAGLGALEAAAVASGRRIPLVDFGARPKQPGGRKPVDGVSVQVKKERKVLKHSFLARLKSGHVGVFQREGDARLPINQKFGPSIPEMIGNQEVVDRIQANAEQRFSKTLDHEIDFALQKLGAR